MRRPPILRFRLRACVLTSVALALSGCAASIHHRAGLAAMEKGDYPQAISELQKAVELAPREIAFRKDWLQNREVATEHLLLSAGSALAQGKLSKAEEGYRKLLGFDAGNSKALAGLETIAAASRAADDVGQAHQALKRGDTAEAAQWNARALQRFPGSQEAKALKHQIETRQATEVISPESLGGLYSKPINLEFRDASPKMVFDALSRTTGINFVFDRDVKTDQSINMFLKQTTLEDAIDVLLATGQLEKKILSPTSVLIYPNTPNKVKEYQDLVVKAFYLANVEAKQAAGMLKTVLKVKDVFVDDKYNMLVLRENPDTIALAEKLIGLHDLEEPEVMLEVEVLEVNRTRLLNLGVHVTDQFTVTPLAAGGGAAVSSIKLTDLLALTRDKLGVTIPGATVNMQKMDGDANLLANPRIRVRDREKAKILIGDKVPVVTTTTTPNGFLSESIQYVDVGLKLDVEPEIRLGDEIGLRMSLEVSSLVSSVKTNSGSQAYQIGTRNFNSVLRLKDGETQVLAGLISDADRSSANRVPLLGDVPLLGRLFSSQKDDRQKTEIVLSITPHLIRSMRRKDPASESFWSGTETTLRNKALRLRPFDATRLDNKQASPMLGIVASPRVMDAGDGPAVNTSGIQLQWHGKKTAKVGEEFAIELQLNSIHLLRAAPLQLAFDPAQFEVVAIKEGEFFNRIGKGAFNHSFDNASGRIAISVAGDNGGAKGDGKLLTLILKPLSPAAEAKISVIAITPIGAGAAVTPPPLPVAHLLEVLP